MSDFIRNYARQVAAKAIAQYRTYNQGLDYSAWQALEAACKTLAQSAAWAVQSDDIDNARIYAQVMTDLEASQDRLIERRKTVEEFTR